WHGPPAMRAPDHFRPAVRLRVEVDLLKRDALASEQRLGHRAIGAPPRRVHLDLSHQREAPKPTGDIWRVVFAGSTAFGGYRRRRPAPRREFVPAVRFHKLGPAAVEVSQIM